MHFHQDYVLFQQNYTPLQYTVKRLLSDTKHYLEEDTNSVQHKMQNSIFNNL